MRLRMTIFFRNTYRLIVDYTRKVTQNSRKFCRNLLFLTTRPIVYWLSLMYS